MFGVKRVIRTEAYYVPDATIRLFSPKCYFWDQGKGRCIIDGKCVQLELQDSTTLEFPYNAGNNLPMMLADEMIRVGVAFNDIQTLRDPTP